MPRIEIQISDKVHEQWREFSQTMQASSLIESGLLGDWMVQGFLNNLHTYLKEGGPVAQETKTRRKDRLDNEARRKLLKQQKRVLPMFNENDRITIPEISRVLGLDQEQGEALVRQWIAEEFLTPSSPRDGEEAFTLSEDWHKRNLSANRPSLNAHRSVYRPAAAIEEK